VYHLAGYKVPLRRRRAAGPWLGSQYRLSCCITFLVFVPESFRGSSSCVVGSVVSEVLEHVGDVPVDVPAQQVFEFLDAWHEEVVCVVISGPVCRVMLFSVVDMVRLRITKRLTIKVFGFDRFFCPNSWTGFFLSKGRHSFSPSG